MVISSRCNEKGERREGWILFSCIVLKISLLHTNLVSKRQGKPLMYCVVVQLFGNSMFGVLHFTLPWQLKRFRSLWQLQYSCSTSESIGNNPIFLNRMLGHPITVLQKDSSLEKHVSQPSKSILDMKMNPNSKAVCCHASFDSVAWRERNVLETFFSMEKLIGLQHSGLPK